MLLAQQRAILVFIRKVFDYLKRSEVNVTFLLLLDYAVKTAWLCCQNKKKGV